MLWLVYHLELDGYINLSNVVGESSEMQFVSSTVAFDYDVTPYFYFSDH
ncbi:protein of unknown function [Moritella yayanosii]|uniref:Uncharacterized protein n=1 Tax=Moritella yayanosii TaxID=69539 RepID=A0A330LNC2_9GAMM|nr:protein of unknown function [Moritella yayanosii]